MPMTAACRHRSDLRTIREQIGEKVLHRERAQKKNALGRAGAPT